MWACIQGSLCFNGTISKHAVITFSYDLFFFMFFKLLRSMLSLYIHLQVVHTLSYVKSILSLKGVAAVERAAHSVE